MIERNLERNYSEKKEEERKKDDKKIAGRKKMEW